MAGTSNTKPINLVLFGKVGNGKSSLGNTILGKTEIKEDGEVVDVKPFVSKASAAGITVNCQLEETTLANGQVVNVIDTPGLFDPNVEPEKLRKLIVECMEMTMDGIHAFLLVLSIKNRFSDEENMAIKYLTQFFGEGIIDHGIVVYTGGDNLEDDMTLEEYLSADCPRSLKNLHKACNDRVVVFDNRTKDKKKREEQIQQLMSHVDEILAMSDGDPFTNELFKEMQKQARWKPEDQSNLERMFFHEEQMRKINEAMGKRFEEAAKLFSEELEQSRKREEHERMQLQALIDSRRERNLAPTYTIKTFLDYLLFTPIGCF